nr:unnamed protein product [Callosobruchus analis]
MFETMPMDICLTIPGTFNISAIKTLKIDGLYWIPAHNILQLLTNLENLNELYALDTTLNISHSKAYTKLTKLSLTVDIHGDFKDLESAINLKQLKYLSLKLINSRPCPGSSEEIKAFLSRLNLNELWILNRRTICTCLICSNDIILNLPNLSKFVLGNFHALIEFHLRYPLNILFMVFSSYKAGVHIFVRNNRINNRKFNFSLGNVQRAWDFLTNSSEVVPCGTEFIQMLLDGSNNINFVDFNLGSLCSYAYEEYSIAAFQILMSKSCKSLKRQCLLHCFFAKCNFSTTQNENGIPIDPNLFNQITKSLKELQIQYCSCNTIISTYLTEGYITIDKFTNLEKLNLDVPYFLDGLFLESIFKQCEKLHTLCLKCLSQNKKFMDNLYNSLKYATVLKDFSLKSQEIKIDKLLENFNTIRQKKILRMFLNCYVLKYDNTRRKSDVYEKFIKENPQLVLFFIVAYRQSSKKNRKIQNILNDTKDNNAKVFAIYDNLFEICKYKIPLPTVQHDMVLQNFISDETTDRWNISINYFENF